MRSPPATFLWCTRRPTAEGLAVFVGVPSACPVIPRTGSWGKSRGLVPPDAEPTVGPELALVDPKVMQWTPSPEDLAIHAGASRARGGVKGRREANERSEHALTPPNRRN